LYLPLLDLGKRCFFITVFWYGVFMEIIEHNIEKIKASPSTNYFATQIVELGWKLDDTKKMAEDPEMKDLVQEEIESLTAQINAFITQASEIIKKEEEAGKESPKEIILEIRAGAGGDEASLFAKEIAEMYERYAENQSWSWTAIDASLNELGGYKEASFEVKGEDVFKFLKWETGVHRVQRIPATEKQGRIHTSTISVAAMPFYKRTSIELNPGDLEFETSRSGGPGGQNANKIESAVRVIHKPTGVDVRSTVHRTQLKNKEEALSVLRSKLQALKDEAELAANTDARRKQIGTGDRSEKIRTYNFPQDRITDHRIKESWSNIGNIMTGSLSKVIDTILEKQDELENE
jgi:peptide chain release factor 1